MPQLEPLCLVLTPFGRKRDSAGRIIDFEAVYHRLIEPAVQAAGLKPVRGEDERSGGLIDQAMYQRLAVCDYAVVDLTSADPAVFYQLGVRHALKPHTTVLLYATGTAQVPIDPQQFAAISYRVSPQGPPVHEAKSRTLLTERLRQARTPGTDSPPYLLVENFPEVDRESSERALKERMLTVEEARGRLAEARLKGSDAVREVADSMGDMARADPVLQVELLYAFRATKRWGDLIALVSRMPVAVAATVVVQELLALALSWEGRLDEAERGLRDFIFRRGPSSESYGMLGRILKNNWELALERGETELARELLSKAAAAYMRGFESDWRNTYTGVNAVALMELKEPADPRRREILPVVHYAVEQRIRSGAAGYWDYATLLELAALSCDEAKGIDALGRTLARVREAWEPKTTVRALRFIREARLRRGTECPEWLERAEAELLEAAERGTAAP